MYEIIQGINKILNEVKQIKADLNTRNTPKLKAMQDEWIDTQDVLLLLKISAERLRQLRKKHQIKTSRIGRKLYYKISDISKLLETHYEEAEDI